MPACVSLSVVHGVCSCFWCFAACPTSVGFMARAAVTMMEAALAKNLPQRSRANEFTAGRVLRVKDIMSLMVPTGYERVPGTSLTSWERGQRLERFRRTSGSLAKPPHPLCQDPFGLETHKTLGRLLGRVMCVGFRKNWKEKCSETSSAPGMRVDGICPRQSFGPTALRRMMKSKQLKKCAT
jgi:hypothetical protein